jgi:hypothetical protein
MVGRLRASEGRKMGILWLDFSSHGLNLILNKGDLK